MHGGDVVNLVMANELEIAIRRVMDGDSKLWNKVKEVSEFARNSLMERYCLLHRLSPQVKILEALLPKGMIIPFAFEIVGHIAHLNLREEHEPCKNLIAKVVLDKNKTKIKTIVNKFDAIHNDYRTLQFEVLAGNHSLVTVVVENGLRFNVDLASTFEFKACNSKTKASEFYKT